MFIQQGNYTRWEVFPQEMAELLFQIQGAFLVVFCRNTCLFVCVLPDQLVLAKRSSSILTELYHNSSDNPEGTRFMFPKKIPTHLLFKPWILNNSVS